MCPEACETLPGQSTEHVDKVQPKQLPWLDSFLFSVFDNFAQKAIQTGFMTLYLPDGRMRTYGSEDSVSSAIPDAPEWRQLPPLRCTVTIHNPIFFYKVMTRHDTGLGEAYMHNDFSVDNLGAFMAVITANAFAIEGNRGVLGVFNWIGDKLLYLAHLTRANTFEGSKKNISEHYDAGNDMYKLFLDSTLTYSSGIHHEGCSLEEAQFKKLDALIEGAKITKDSTVLEVGCGWGSCAIRAVQTTGCKWIGACSCVPAVLQPCSLAVFVFPPVLAVQSCILPLHTATVATNSLGMSTIT
jgi:cyclopropane-fatty-acyl-phospholipid synthase